MLETYKKGKIICIVFLSCVMMTTTLTTSVQMMKCLEEIITSNFSPGKVIVLALPVPSDYTERSLLNFEDEMASIYSLISNLNSKVMWPLVISTDNQINENDIPEPHHGYVIFLLSYENILDSIECHVEKLRTFNFSYKRRAKFIIVILQQDIPDTLSISTDVLKKLWQLDNIANVVTLSRGREQSSYDIHSIFPFHSEDCEESETVALLEECTSEGAFLNHKDLFPEKVPLDLHGCTFSVFIRILPPYTIYTKIDKHNNGADINNFGGFDMVYVRFLSEAMNFSLKLEFYSIDPIAVSNIFSEREIKRGVLVGAANMNPLFLAWADLTKSYIFEDNYLFVPCARPNPTFGNVLKVFTTSVWLSSILCLILAAVLLSCFNKYNIESHSYTTFSGSLLNCWAIFLSVSIDTLPVKTESRLFFLVFLSFSFAMNTIFQSFFTSFLIDPGFEKQIETLDDINKRQVTFTYYDGYEYEEHLSGTDLLTKLKYKKVCPDYFEGLQDIVKYRNSSGKLDRNSVKYVSSTYGFYSPLEKYDCTIMSFNKQGISILLLKGNPLIETFNYFIQIALESGVADRYISLTTSKNLVQNYNKHNEGRTTYTALGLLHLQMCFLFLVFGYAMSISVWIMEFVHFKFTLKKMN